MIAPTAPVARSHKLQPEPVITIATFISQKHRRVAVVDDENIRIAVVVIIAYGETARRKSLLKTAPDFTLTFLYLPSAFSNSSKGSLYFTLSD
jgi:hypothetical protein